MQEFTPRIEHPKTPTSSDDAEVDDRITFGCDPDFRLIQIPPTAAEVHLDSNRENHESNTGFSHWVKDSLLNDDIKGAFGNGWILHTQEKINIPISNGETMIDRDHLRDSIQNHIPFQTPEGEIHHIVTIRTFWAPLTSEDISLLITHPHFVDNEQYTALTRVVDADRFPAYIDIPVLFHTEERIRIPYGQAIAQVIPLSKQFVCAQAEIVPGDSK